MIFIFLKFDASMHFNNHMMNFIISTMWCPNKNLFKKICILQYLGCVEVFESRGMQVCEEALKVLRVSRRTFTKFIKP